MTAAAYSSRTPEADLSPDGIDDFDDTAGDEHPDGFGDTFDGGFGDTFDDAFDDGFDGASGRRARTGAGRGSGPSVLDTGPVAAADLVRPAQALARRAGPALPVLAPLRAVLPEGLRRGSTVSVVNSISLLLALLGGPSASGVWCATVGLPAISAEAAAEYGIDLARLAIVPSPGAGWLTAVGALLDAVDVVVVRPPAQVTDGDLRRLAARVRGRDAVLVPYLGGRARWPRADVELTLQTERWTGLGVGHGRLHARQVTVSASGRGRAVRPRSVGCWLPAAIGGIAPLERTSPLAVAPGSVPLPRPVVPRPPLSMPELRAG